MPGAVSPLTGVCPDRTENGRRRTQRSTSAQAQATATCPTGLLNPGAEWYGEPEEFSPCPPPRYVYRAASRAAGRVAPPCHLRHAGGKNPPLLRQIGRLCGSFRLPVPRGCPCFPPALSPLGPSARGGHPGPPATVHAAGSITPRRTRLSGVSPAAVAGADQGKTPSRPFARHYAAR